MPSSKISAKSISKKSDFENFSLVEIDNENIELVAMKPAQNEDAWGIRLVNLNSKIENTCVNLKFGPREILECNLAEIPLKNRKIFNVLNLARTRLKASF